MSAKIAAVPAQQARLSVLPICTQHVRIVPTLLLAAWTVRHRLKVANFGRRIAVNSGGDDAKFASGFYNRRVVGSPRRDGCLAYINSAGSSVRPRTGEVRAMHE